MVIAALLMDIIVLVFAKTNYLVKPDLSRTVGELNMLMVEQIMPFYAVVHGHASCWKGDANFRSQILRKIYFYIIANQIILQALLLSYREK